MTGSFVGNIEFKFEEALVGVMPIVCNTVEHVTAVSMAMKDTIDLAPGIALGSSVQIGLFV